MLEDSEELRIRIFDDVEGRAALGGGAIPAEVLNNYVIDGERMPLRDVGRGIRNVDGWKSSLSITAYERGAYRDREV